MCLDTLKTKLLVGKCSFSDICSRMNPYIRITFRIATAFKKSDYEIDVVRTESPKDTVELCKLYKPFVLIMEVTGYTPWKLCERMKLRDEVKRVCPDCKIAFIVDSNTEKQAAKDIRDAKKNGLIDQFFYGSMTAEYLMDQIYAM